MSASSSNAAASGHMDAPAKKPRLQSALARFSETSVWHMKQLLAGKEKMTQRSGAWKRKTAKMWKPIEDCYDLVAVPNATEGAPDVRFAVADVRKVLRYVAEQCPSFKIFLQSLRHPADIILCHDEATAGNVLGSDQRQKVNLFYVTFRALSATHESAHAWLPMAAVTHEQAAHSLGGLGQCHAAFVRAWAQQNLHIPWTVTDGISVSLRLSFMVADMAAQQAALQAKGSAGLRPCAFCRNVVSRDAAAASDPTFKTIAEHNVDEFQENSMQELEAYMLQAIREAPHRTKKEQALRSTCLGFNINPHGMWNCQITRATLGLDRFCNDSMHCYFANGLCSFEIVHLLSLVVGPKTLVGLELPDLCRKTLDAGWTRSSSHVKHGENQYWLKRLWTESLFGESLYKGSAKQTLVLVALLRWLAETEWSHVSGMEAAVDCWLKLCLCVDHVKRPSKDFDGSALRAAQASHQEAFAKLWPQYVRPKHHHRLHLPAHWAKFRSHANCWGTESKHRDYKGCFAKDLQQWLTDRLGGSEFSSKLLPRLLLRHAELLNERPISQCGFQLVDPFCAEEVARTTGVEGCIIASHCRIGLLDVYEGDFILWDNGRCGGLCSFFLAKQDALYVHIQCLRLVSSSQSKRVFQRTNGQDVKAWSSMANPFLPTLWRKHGNMVECLP